MQVYSYIGKNLPESIEKARNLEHLLRYGDGFPPHQVTNSKKHTGCPIPKSCTPKPEPKEPYI